MSEMVIGADIRENARRQFGKQADAYSKGSTFTDKNHLFEIVKRSGVNGDHTVLDIATGAGFLAFEFAKNAGSVVGIDLTRNMIVHAKDKTTDPETPDTLDTPETLGLGNIEFLLSDVESLPFEDNTFDIVTCRFAFHHFPDPKKALFEMKRVCKDKGCIVLVDGTSSEMHAKSQFQNHIEELRDPSHVRIYQLSEMQDMFNDIGVVITDTKHWDLPQDFNDWIERSGIDEDRVKIIEDMMFASAEGDATGLRVKIENGKPNFTYDTVILVAEVRK
ncbi:MAG: methyltransferase domain-containing protein [Methanosarcinales archaeon]|nr:methyltransferase domain-containing protein [Methanosarcinales archaeon]